MRRRPSNTRPAMRETLSPALADDATGEKAQRPELYTDWDRSFSPPVKAQPVAGYEQESVGVREIEIEHTRARPVLVLELLRRVGVYFGKVTVRRNPFA